MKHNSKFKDGSNKKKIIIIGQASDDDPKIIKAERIEIVHSFVYLGSLITNSGKLEAKTWKIVTIIKIAVKKLWRI